MEKGETFEFYLDENPIQGIYLKDSDIFEEDDKIEGNELYFLKISKALKINCIIKKEEPDDESFNKDTSTEISEICQSSIELEDDFKLIPFPKHLNKDEKIYFIFFNDEKNPDDYLKASGYTVKIASFPKPLEIKDEPYEININSKDTSIYLLRHQPEKFNVFTIFSDFNISFYGYKNKGFLKLGCIGDKFFIFQLNNEIKLDNIYYYAIFDNEKKDEEKIKILYNERLQLFNVNINETSKIEFEKFNTTYALIQIYNPEQKLININYPQHHSLRILEKDFKDLEKLLDISSYKYIPQGYIYIPNDYSLFLLNPKLKNEKNITIEVVNLNNYPHEIESNYFIYFKISKGEELSFNVKNKENKIIIKSICINTGNIEINDETYKLVRQNQILEINKKETFTIKALDNEFILAIKSEISDEFIQYNENNESYKVQNENNSTFVALKIDYKNYDYVKFTFNDEDSKRNYNTSIDFGFLDKYEFSTNEIIENIDYIVVYELSYYKVHENEKDLIKLYYIDNITNTSSITFRMDYYKEFSFEPYKFHRVGPNKLMGKFVNSVRLFFLTKGFSIFELNCLTLRGIMFYNNYFDSISANEYDCFAELDMDGYVFIQPMNNENDTYYYDEYITRTISNLKYKDENNIKLSFAYNFTNVSNFNYTLIITEQKNEDHFKDYVEAFEYFYLNNSYKESEFEIYKFSLNDMEIDSNNTANIILKNPTKFNINDEYLTFIYSIIAETSPIRMFQIYDLKTYEKKDEDIPEEEEEDEVIPEDESEEQPEEEDEEKPEEESEEEPDDESEEEPDDESEEEFDDESEEEPDEKKEEEAEEESKEEKEDDDKTIDDSNTFLLILSIVIGVIIILIIIVLVMRKLKRKNNSIERQIDDNKEMSLPMTEVQN